MRAFLKKSFPSLRHTYRRARNRLYLRQKAISHTAKYQGFQFSIPSNHKLMRLRDEQPNREGGLRVAAAKIFARHPEKVYVDVGANIGDTAAVVRSVSPCTMVLVEPSDVFYPYLCKNAGQFGANVKALHGFFVPPGDVNATFELLHSEGTAQPYKTTHASSDRHNYTLDQLSSSPIGLLKIDTDGYDLNLISGYLDQLASSDVNVYFELEVRSRQDVTDWLACMAKLLSKGYVEFLLWDDPGHFMCSVGSLELARQLLNWQLSYVNDNYKGTPRIFNFDVLAVTGMDCDIAVEIEQSYAL